MHRWLLVNSEVHIAPHKNRKMYEIVLINQNAFPVADNSLFRDVFLILLLLKCPFSYEMVLMRYNHIRSCTHLTWKVGKSVIPITLKILCWWENPKVWVSVFYIFIAELPLPPSTLAPRLQHNASCIIGPQCYLLHKSIGDVFPFEATRFTSHILK